MAGEKRSNYAKMRDAMADVFLQYDQSAMIRKFGLEHDAAYLYVAFVNRPYRIDRRSGKVSWSEDGFLTQEDADYNAAMTIYDVLCCSKADCCLAREWVSVGSLSGIRGGTLGKGSNFFQDAGKLFSGQTQALDPEASDVPFGFGSGGGVIFGVTGGVTEAVLRRLIPEHNKAALDAIAQCGVRGDEAIKEVSFDYNGKQLNICVVSGLINARKVMEQVRSGEANYHLIEVMACRQGCIMGGGQPPRTTPIVKSARAKGIYSADNLSIIKKPDENPMIIGLYEGFLKGKTHELLHNSGY